MFRSIRKNISVIITCAVLLAMCAIIVQRATTRDHKAWASKGDTLVRMPHDSVKLVGTSIEPSDTALYDSNTFEMSIMTGFSTVDKDGVTIDSSYNDKWYKCDYKIVPETGTFIDTAIHDEKKFGYRYIVLTLIKNRALVFCVTFTQPYPDSNYNYWTDFGKQ